MRWAWTGVDLEEELRQLDERLAAIHVSQDEHVDRFERLAHENRLFTRECVAMMQRAANRQEKALEKVFARTDDMLAEQRAQREALLRMLDRLGPAPGEA